jgi:hypothetical protein
MGAAYDLPRWIEVISQERSGAAGFRGGPRPSTREPTAREHLTLPGPRWIAGIYREASLM